MPAIAVKGRRFQKITPGAPDPGSQTYNVGSGSGALVVDGSALGAQPGDTVLVAPGSYNSILVQNLTGSAAKRIMVKAGGLVATNGFFNLSNLNYTTVTGASDGDASAKNFYIHDVVYRGMEVSNLKVGVTLEKLRFQNIPDFSIYNTTRTLTYTGTDATTQMRDFKLLSCEWINAGGVGLGGDFDVNENLDIGFIKNLEISGCIYRDRPDAGNVFTAGNVQDYQVHHNTVYNVNKPASEGGNDNHNGLFFFTGNGDFYSNLVYNHAGQALRAWIFSHGSTLLWSRQYNNIVHDSRKYSALEAQSFAYLIGSGKSTYGHVLVANNTTGRLDYASTGFVGVTVDVYSLFGGNCYIYNNVNYQGTNLGNTNGVWSQQSTTTPIASNNVYNATSSGAGLVDTTNFQAAPGGALDGQGLYLNPATWGLGVSLDYKGDVRLNPPSIGALNTADAVVGTYTLDTPALVSAMVVDKATGVQVRELFSGRKLPAGPVEITWNRTDDAGNTVPGTDADYNIIGIASRMNYTWEGTVGNNSLAKTGEQKYRGWNPCSGMVIVNGKAYWAPSYTEGGLDQGCCYFFLDSPRVLRRMANNIGNSGMTHVVSDGNLVYWANNFITTSGNTKVVRNFVFATKVSDDTPATFSAGTSVTADTIFPSAVDYNTVDGQTCSGLAVQQSGNYLFIARQSLNVVRVLNKTTGALVQTLSITSPARIALQGDSFLWVLSGTTATQYPVNSDGTVGASTLAITGLDSPQTLAVAPGGASIAIIQSGALQQIRWYSTTTGALTQTVGQLGGYSVSATVTTDKFMFTSGVTKHPWMYSFMAYAPDGSYWFGDSQNRRMLHYSASNTYIEQIAYLNRPYTVALDPANPTRMMAEYLEYAIDYSKSLDSGDNGSWTLVNNWTGGLPLTGYIDAYGIKSFATFSNGRTYGLVTNTGNTTFEVWEMVAGGTLRRCGTTSTTNLNTGYLITPTGVWRNNTGSQTGWYMRLLTGFDANNNPIFGSEGTAMMTTQVGGTYPRVKVAGIGGVGVSPLAITDSGYYVAFDTDAANGGFRYKLGGVKADSGISGTFRWQTAYTTHPEYRGVFPPDGYFDMGNEMGPLHGLAGSMAMTAGNHIFWGYHGEFWKGTSGGAFGGQTNVWNHVWHNGLFAGQFGTPRPRDVIAPEGMGGNPNYAAVCSVDGRIYLYHGEENDHSGIHRWRIEGGVTEWSIPVTSKVATAPPSNGGVNLLASLPFNQIGVTTATGGGWIFSPDAVQNDTTNKRYWSSQTSYSSYRRSRPDYPESIDINAYYRQNQVLSTPNTISMATGAAVPLATWSLEGDISFQHDGNSDWGGATFEILDAAGKAIATLYRVAVNKSGSPRLWNISANNAVIVAYNSNDPQPNGRTFTITGSASGITIAYGEFTAITRPVAEAGADYTRPTTVRLRFFQTSTFGVDRRVNLKKCIFHSL